MSIPQATPAVQLLAPTTTNGGATSRGVNLKGALRAQIIVDLKQAAAHATVVSLKQATTMALSTNSAGPSVPNWKNEDTAASDAVVKNSDANSVTVASAIKSMQVIFDVDPRHLTAGSHVVYVTASDSSQATNFMNVSVIVEPRYAGDGAPSLVID